jgi:integrase
MNDLEGLSAEQLADLARRIHAKIGPLSPPPAAGGAPPLPSRGRRGRKKKSPVAYLNDEELAALFSAITAGGDPRDLAIFELAYHRGLRASEVGLLQMNHLRLSQKRLYVSRLKNGISGEYLLTEREVRALRRWLAKRGTAAGPLFPSRKRGPITRQRLDQLMKLYAGQAGLPEHKRHFHCLRHSCATSLLDHDVSIELVQDHLGHADIRNTMIYAKVTNKKRRQKDELLQRDW